MTENFKNVPELTEECSYKRADQIWASGYETLSVIMKKVFEQEPQVTYPGADGENYPLVRLRNGSYCMADTPEALSIMEDCLRAWAVEESDRKVLVHAKLGRPREVTLSEYIRRYHNYCCVPLFPQNEGWKKASDIWRHGAKTLKKFMKEIFEQDPPVTYVDAKGEFCLLVGRFRPRNGPVSFYMKGTYEALETMGKYLQKRAEEEPEGMMVDEDGNSISFKEYARRYHNACFNQELPKNEGWMTAPDIWWRGYEMLLKVM